MKTLFVLRHAKAERDSDTGRDFDRPLAQRGWHAARSVGQEMRNRGFAVDAMIASPAKRVVETVTALAETYGPARTDYDQRLYNAPLDNLLEVIGEVDDGVRRLMLVGHNPGLQELLLYLSEGDERGLRDGIRAKYPTAALAAVELPVENWSAMKAGCGEIDALVLPSDLAN